MGAGEPVCAAESVAKYPVSIPQNVLEECKKERKILWNLY